jgi:hypothetical protein
MFQFDRKSETLTRDGQTVAQVQPSQSSEAQIVIGSTILELSRHDDHGWHYQLAHKHEPDRVWQFRPTGLKRGGTLAGETGKLELRASLIHHRRWDLTGERQATIQAHELPLAYPIDRVHEGWQSMTITAEDTDWSTPDQVATLVFACWVVARYESRPPGGVPLQ